MASIYWAAQHKTEPSSITGRHHPDWLKLNESSTQPIIDHWIEYYSKEKSVPPGLITDDGTMIDGNHRLEAVRKSSDGMWCCVVSHYDSLWIGTGRSVWVV